MLALVVQEGAGVGVLNSHPYKSLQAPPPPLFREANTENECKNPKHRIPTPTPETPKPRKPLLPRKLFFRKRSWLDGVDSNRIPFDNAQSRELSTKPRQHTTSPRQKS